MVTTYCAPFAEPVFNDIVDQQGHCRPVVTDFDGNVGGVNRVVEDIVKFQTEEDTEMTTYRGGNIPGVCIGAMPPVDSHVTCTAEVRDSSMPQTNNPPMRKHLAIFSLLLVETRWQGNSPGGRAGPSCTVA